MLLFSTSPSRTNKFGNAFVKLNTRTHTTSIGYHFGRKGNCVKNSWRDDHFDVININSRTKSYMEEIFHNLNIVDVLEEKEEEVK